MTNKVLGLGVSTLLIFGLGGYYLIVSVQGKGFTEVLLSGMSVPIQLGIGLGVWFAVGFGGHWNHQPGFFQKREEVLPQPDRPTGSGFGQHFISVAVCRLCRRAFLSGWITATVGSLVDFYRFRSNTWLPQSLQLAHQRLRDSHGAVHRRYRLPFSTNWTDLGHGCSHDAGRGTLSEYDAKSKKRERLKLSEHQEFHDQSTRQPQIAGKSNPLQYFFQRMAFRCYFLVVHYIFSPYKNKVK